MQRCISALTCGPGKAYHASEKPANEILVLLGVVYLLRMDTSTGPGLSPLRMSWPRKRSQCHFEAQQQPGIVSTM